MKEHTGNLTRHAASLYAGGRPLHSGYRSGRYVKGSFTLEAALLVPMILAVLFLLIQTILYLHDTVWAEVWLFQKAWEERWSLETGEPDVGNDVGQTADFRLTVLQSAAGESGYDMVQHGHTLRVEAHFQVNLLPQIVTMIFTGQQDHIKKQAVEKISDTPEFIRIAGAILEEMP